MIPNIGQLARSLRRPVLALDETFIESQHPRDDGGKFTAGGGNGGAAPQKAQVSSTLTGIFSAGGFKKKPGHNADGSITYMNPTTKVSVHVHPAPAGKKWSSKWTSDKEGKPSVLGEGSALAKLLRVATEKAGAKVAPAATSAATIAAAPDVDVSSLKPGSAAVADALKSEGYFPASANNDGDYAFFNHEDLDAGENEILAFNLKTNKGYFVDEYKAPTLSATAPPTSLAGKAYNDTVDWLKTKDYKFIGPSADNQHAEAIFKAPNGAKVMMNYVTGNWVAETPSHMTKEGNGFDKLQALFNGKIEKGVQNSQKPIQTAAEKASMSEAQQKQVEASKKAAVKANQANTTYSKLKDQAPHPTASQQNAISKYSGSGYSSWNDKLRHDHKYANTDPLTKHLDNYLHSSTFEEEVTLVRKVDGEYAKILKSIIFEGTKFIDRGYVSTSTHKDSWHGSFRFEITVPKGSKGAAIGKWSQHPSENEVLLPRGSAFVVTHYDPNENLVKVTLDQSHLQGSK